MKRSAQVSLVLMAAAGIGAAAYTVAPNDNCRQLPPDAMRCGRLGIGIRTTK